MFASLGACICLLSLAPLLPAQASDPLRPPVALLSGPMVGAATETSVKLWVQTRFPVLVTFRFWPADHPEKARLSAPLRARKSQDHCVHCTLTELPFGTRFQYELYLDGRLVQRPYPLRFQTQPHWHWRTPPPDFTVAFGSCNYHNEPAFDRPGKPYGGDPVIFESLAREHPDLMLWLGDNVYFREPDWSSPSGMRRRYRRGRACLELQALLGASSLYAIWDDHDFGGNDSDRTNPLKAAALSTFKLYWANPSYGLADLPGVFTRFTWGDAEFFLLDDRSYRTPDRARLPFAQKTILGQRQIKWLEESLQSSTAAFKIVVCGNQVLNPLTFYEALGKTPDREALIRCSHLCTGLFFLSGDRHQGELIRIAKGAAYPLFDFTSSPFTAGVHEAGKEKQNPARVAGTLVTGRRNYGLLRFSGQGKQRQVELILKGKQGQPFWRHVILLKDLAPRS